METLFLSTEITVDEPTIWTKFLVSQIRNFVTLFILTMKGAE